MTMKPKSKTPQSVRALKQQKQATPQSAPVKSRGLLAFSGKKSKNSTPVIPKSAKMTPKQLDTNRGKSPKNQSGKKEQLLMKKMSGSADAEFSDDDDDEDFLTGEEDAAAMAMFGDSDDDSVGSEDEMPPQAKKSLKTPPVKKAQQVSTPQLAKKAQPQSAKKAEPQSAKKAEPQSAKKAEPQSAKKAEPQSAKKAEPQSAKKAEPQSAKKAEPQSAKKAKPQQAKNADQAEKSKNNLKNKRKGQADHRKQIDLNVYAQELKEDEQRKAERDRRTLFVKNLPDDITEDKLLALSDGMEEVRIKFIYKRGKRVPTHAFLVFKSDVEAKKQFKKVCDYKFDDKALKVDFVGVYSQNRTDPKPVRPFAPNEIDPYKLYVTGFGNDVTANDLSALFPDSCDIVLPTRASDKRLIGFAFVEFADDALARRAHDSTQGKMIGSKAITVLFARKQQEKAKKRKAEKKPEENPAKKAKVLSTKTPKVDKAEDAELDEDDDDEDFDEDDDDEDLDEDESGEDDDDDDDDD